MSTSTEPFFRAIASVGIVVANADQTMCTYANRFGVALWQVRIQENECGRYKLALAHIGKTAWQLIEPLEEKCLFADYLRQKGEGLHYLGYLVKDLDEALAACEQRNIRVVGGKRRQQKRFAFLDTSGELKHTALIYERESDLLSPTASCTCPAVQSGSQAGQPFFKEVRQVGIAVKNIKETAKVFWDRYRIGPWAFYRYYSPKVSRMSYRGELLTSQKFTTAAAMIGDVELELMEPGDGQNVYAEHIAKCGEGPQHVSFIYARPYAMVMEFHRLQGHSIKQQGTINGLTYNYIDTEAELKIVSEPLDVPQNFVMPKKDDEYPAATDS